MNLVFQEYMQHSQHNYAAFFIYFNMKNVLNYKYNLYPDRVINVKDSYYFFIYNNKYYIVKLNIQV